MQAIKFVVRRSAGDFERGVLLNQVDTGQISLDLAGTAGSVVPQDISLHLARHQTTQYGRDGSSLWITLADGRSLEIENFFLLMERLIADCLSAQTDRFQKLFLITAPVKNCSRNIKAKRPGANGIRRIVCCFMMSPSQWDWPMRRGAMKTKLFPC